MKGADGFAAAFARLRGAGGVSGIGEVLFLDAGLAAEPGMRGWQMPGAGLTLRDFLVLAGFGLVMAGGLVAVVAAESPRGAALRWREETLFKAEIGTFSPAEPEGETLTPRKISCFWATISQ